MSYFAHQSLHPSAPNPTIPQFQSLSSIPQIDPYALNPYPDSGVYPYTYAGSEVQLQPPPQQQQPINYSDNNVATTSWVVHQAPPIKYTTIQPLGTEAVASTTYETPSFYNLLGQKSVTKIPRKKSKKPKVAKGKSFVNQSVRCQLCNIECNTVEVYEKHLSGKKHEKGLLKLCAPALQSAALQAPQSSGAGDGQGTAGVPNKPVNLEVKKQKLLGGGAAMQSIRVCTTCNVTCNGEIAFADHLVGKKHLAKERARSTAANPNAVQTNATTTKKRKSGEPAPAWCDVCKISCTNQDGLNIHLVGKKHQKNLQKLQNPNSNVTPAASVAAPPNNTTTTAVPSVSNSQQSKKKKAASKDVETKKQNLLGCGAAADAMRTCTTCNVVCNSQRVFDSHLAGQKHASMLKQAQAANNASGGLSVAYPST